MKRNVHRVKFTQCTSLFTYYTENRSILYDITPCSVNISSKITSFYTIKASTSSNSFFWSDVLKWNLIFLGFLTAPIISICRPISIIVQTCLVLLIAYPCIREVYLLPDERIPLPRWVWLCHRTKVYPCSLCRSFCTLTTSYPHIRDAGLHSGDGILLCFENSMLDLQRVYQYCPKSVT